ncbi:methyltransferase [Nocardioides sp. Soil777]|nr:methyltransferase [Nocardioides sp. Soil777]
MVQPGAAVSHETWERPTADQLNRYRSLPTANIGDAMHRLGALDAAIKPVWEGATIVGSAYTVWTRPGDNLGLHAALEHVQPGDVIVVNGGGDLSRALLGELIGGKAKVKGVVGFVIDGAVRDATGLEEYSMPVYARALTPAGPYKDGPFALASPVAVGGVVVSPGDIVVADEDGVVVIPLAMAERVADLAQAKHEDELAIRRRIDADLDAVPDSGPDVQTRAG